MLDLQAALLALAAMALLVLVLVDGLHGFAWSRGALALWRARPRRSATAPLRRRPAKPARGSLPKADGDELERSIQRFFEEQDRDADA